MKRLLIAMFVIVVVLILFPALVGLRVRARRPGVLLAKARVAAGADREKLLMQLMIASSDATGAMLDEFESRAVPSEFRQVVLEMLFKRNHRVGDERIVQVLRGAARDPDSEIRRAAVLGFCLYGSLDDQVGLIECMADPDPGVRRQADLLFSGGRGGRDRTKELWGRMTEAQKERLVSIAKEQMIRESDPDLVYLIRSVLGRAIAIQCDESMQAFQTADWQQADRLLRQAQELDPASERPHIRLVRLLLAMDAKQKAIDLADKRGSLVRIPRLKSVPVIDGDPSETAWADSYRGGLPYRNTSSWASSPADGKSEVYLGHLNGRIYVAVLGFEDDLTELVVKHKGRDSDVWRDDCVELFLDPGAGEKDYYQFVINAAGELFDRYGRNSKVNVNCKYAAGMFHDRGYWACEFSVAAADLHDRKLTADGVWGVSIVRTRIGPGAECCSLWPMS